MTGIETVDNDEELWTLNDGIQDLYSSFFKQTIKMSLCILIKKKN